MSKSMAPALTGNLAGYDAALVREPPRLPGSRRRAGDAPAVKSSATRRASSYVARPLRALPPLMFAAALVAALLVGWHNNEEGHLTPEKGLGYWLGIVGSLAMLALLLYPLRKRFGQVRWLGSTAAWFRVHMMLGLIGPALILVHSNFKPGSLNSAVALAAMLLVAGSGLVGRYLYGRVHMGLYGRKARMQEILADRDAFHDAIGVELPEGRDIIATLEAHGERSMAASLPARLLLQRGRSRRLRWRLVGEARTLIRTEGPARGWSRREQRRRVAQVGRHLSEYFAAVDKAAAFGIYDRLFAAWHIAHLPMFLLLVIAAIAHVVAVHLY